MWRRQAPHYLCISILKNHGPHPRLRRLKPQPLKMYTTTALLSLLSLAAAQNFSTWSPPGPGDVRSPCPGLNSLANHGILPHSGKGMTLPILIKGLKDGMNVGADFATAIGGAGLLSVPGNLLATSFDLNDLDEHNFPIEHDASLSR